MSVSESNDRCRNSRRLLALCVALLMAIATLAFAAPPVETPKSEPAKNAANAADAKTPPANPDKALFDKAADEKPAADKPAEGKVAADKAAVDKPGDKLKEGDKAKSAEKSKDGKEAGEETTAKKAENVLLWLYRSMGLRYVVIFLTVTFNEIALVVMILLELRRRRICPMDLAAQFEDRLNKRQYQEAYDLVKDDRSFLGKVLAAGMAHLSEGHQAATDAMLEVGEEQNMRLEQRNGYIALIAQLGPLLGLLATVDGIVHAFSVIAGKDVTPKPSELAQGISIALVNTVVGLWIAIPSIVFYQFVRNRLNRLVHEVSIVSTRLMKRFANVAPAKKA